MMTTTNRPSFHLLTKQVKRTEAFVKSPFRYPGGKYYALGHILPFIFCVPHDEYREPFVGGGSVFFAKPKAKLNWINDLETNLIETYKTMATVAQRELLIEKIIAEVATRERHAEVKKMNVTSILDLAFKTYYLNRTSYSGIIHKPAWGYRDGKSSPPPNWGAFIKDAGEKLEGIKITAQDFEDVIKAPTTTESVLMYLDPPYFHADQKRAYTKPFELADHVRLANVLRQTPYLFCLSYDDCAEIRDLYTWAEVYEASWLYNTANLSGEARKLGKELIITNYRVLKPIEHQPLLL